MPTRREASSIPVLNARGRLRSHSRYAEGKSILAEPEGAGTYPTQADVLTAKPLLDWIDENFLRPDPFAFRDVSFRPVVALIRRELDVEPNGIYCVGSGAVGYSMSPKKVRPTGLKPFDESSDLDLAIISEMPLALRGGQGNHRRATRRAGQPRGGPALKSLA
jgi:hypothetical protein